MSNPRILIIRLLEACNAGCFMCGFSFSKDSFRFTLDDLEALTSQGQFSSIKLVRFTGGEPLLIPNLADYVSLLRSKGVRTSVITNGWHLPARSQQLIEAGIDHVIVSIDGHDANSHDKFRRLPGLFDQIALGIHALKASSQGVVMRVNTVVGRHNIKTLPLLWDLLVQLKVDQWSLIPLKRQEGAWGTMTLEQMRVAVTDLANRVRETKQKKGPTAPHVLGYGLHLFGRTDEEMKLLWHDSRNIAPRGVCRLVDQVRYYVPKEGIIFPCNCVPHRSDAAQSHEKFDRQSLTHQGLTNARNRLRAYGHAHCRGCEPVNAALADGEIDLDHDPLGF